ncbi:hypothetical protein WA026_000430 [Henosepilachna vigintioctopunctata]|uniref:Uncharacterized protein n=1 Tax=Henosepilachna vigintioctopunctata TaxID=420089 RepID=A0AAW1UXJ5_9CUCU
MMVILFALHIFILFILTNGQGDTSEIISEGRMQYQLLRERGNLPKYGPCWKSALETVDEGCRELSEETQSDIALSLSNCFLEMSGLETYHCDTDKKQNVRQICISAMTDRAFNVYTEFYTHTLNMCWFLRGQIWQETISENTLKVGKQLETSAVQQEKLLQIQRESLEIQDHMLKHGKVIENVLADLSSATQNHQEMLYVMGQTINNLQSWLVGEVSWFNTLVFYIGFGIFVIIVTSTPRTITSRLPILSLLVVHIFVERWACNLILNNGTYRNSAKDLYGDIYDCVQLIRYVFISLCFGILIYKAYFHDDILSNTRNALDSIYKQNTLILKKLESKNTSMILPDKTYLVYKTNMHSIEDNDCRDIFEDKIMKNGAIFSKKLSEDLVKDSIFNSVSPTLKRSKYNLRSGQNTPNGFE